MAGRPTYKAEAFEGKNLLLFFLIAFGWTWVWWWVLFLSGLVRVPEEIGTRAVGVDSFTNPLIILLVILSPFGPTIGAFVLTAINEGRVGVSALWGRFWNLRIPWRWLIVIFLWWPFLRLLTNLLGQVLSGESNPLLVYPDHVYVFIPSLIVSTFVNGGMSEEFGWRGYALPRLQVKFNALTSSIILGAVEGLWHYPLIIMGQWWQQSIVALVFWLILTAVMRTWIYNNTNGNLLAAMLFHGMGNVQSDIVWCCSRTSHIYWVYGVATVLIILIFGPRTLTRSPGLSSVETG